MKEANKKKVTIEEIEQKALRGEDVTGHFSGGKMVEGYKTVERVRKDVQRVNVDFAQPMLNELDEVANELNVSRQSIIKTMLREALDRLYAARQVRKTR